MKSSSLKSVLSELESLAGKEISGSELLSKLSKFVSVDKSFLYYLKSLGALREINTSSRFENYTFSVDRSKLSLALIENAFEQAPNFNDKCEVIINYPKKFSELSELGFGILYPNLIKLFVEAKSEILIINPFFDYKTNEDLAKIFNTYISPKIKIKIISRKEFGQGNSTQNKKLKHFLTQLNTTAELRVLGEDQKENFRLHAKALIIDNNLAYIGSANLSDMSLDSNIETGVIISGPSVKRLHNFFNILWDFGERI